MPPEQHVILNAVHDLRLLFGKDLRLLFPVRSVQRGDAPPAIPLLTQHPVPVATH